jgi:hypothetical protein
LTYIRLIWWEELELLLNNSFVGECSEIFDEQILEDAIPFGAFLLEDSVWIDDENGPHLAAIFADNGREYGPMTSRPKSISSTFRKAMNINDS